MAVRRSARPTRYDDRKASPSSGFSSSAHRPAVRPTCPRLPPGSEPVFPAPDRAVFLSYAREDSDAVRRIAEALRAFGIEAWFDQSELWGGDSWDGKIRGQIRACALFMPIVSARTQARHEGYFSREWKLDVERTHDMAAGVAFIVPVVIDDTPEREAAVPDEFMHV